MAKKRQSAEATAMRSRPGKASSGRSPVARKGAAAKKKTAARPAARKVAPRKAAAPTRKASPSPQKSIKKKTTSAPAKPAASKVKTPAPRTRRAGGDDKTLAAAPPAAPAAPRKPGFYEAVAVYERGVQALQRHDYDGAAAHFRTVLEKYPSEQELLERARLYLRVCERETERQPAAPKTPEERVYAATVALNSGDHTGALDHLQRALGEDPDSDHAHYIMAVALGMRGRHNEAFDHLRRAIALNPDNRGLAREDPDLESLRGQQQFGSALNTPAAAGRRRSTRRS